jgi:hypothetical protein
MATYFLSPVSTILQAFTNQGVPLANGKIYTYLAGTTTPTNTWTDSTGGVLNANPIVLDSAGRIGNPNVMIWQQSRVPIKAVFKDAAGVQIGPTFDQISGVGDPGSLLQSFYGTDSGAANAYIITVAGANFSSYVDGTVIYWKATNANTTSSTVNVNGLGAVSLFYADGSALTSGAIPINAMVEMVCLGGNFYMLASPGGSFSSGSFTPTWTGFSSPPSGGTNVVFWSKIGNVVVLQFGSGTTGTSNTTGMTISNLPSNLRPSTAASARSPIIVTDSGAEAMGAIGVTSAGVITFFKGTSPPSSSGFTNSGTKGVGPFVYVTYSI